MGKGLQILGGIGGSNVELDSTLTTQGKAADAKAVGDGLAKKLTIPTTAEIGQTIVVKSVDENGKPTEWESADLPSGGGGGGEWKDILPYGEIGQDLATIEYTNLNAKKVLFYGFARLNDAENTLNTGTKRVAVYVNGRASQSYVSLLDIYTRTSGKFYFRILIDVESGLLMANESINGGNVTQDITPTIENNKVPMLVDKINEILIEATVDGEFFFKADSLLGVKVYE